MSKSKLCQNCHKSYQDELQKCSKQNQIRIVNLFFIKIIHILNSKIVHNWRIKIVLNKLELRLARGLGLHAFSLVSLEKCVKLHKRQKVIVFMDFIRETKDFKFWNVELGCHFCSFLRKSHLYAKRTIAIFTFLKYIKNFFVCFSEKVTCSKCNIPFYKMGCFIMRYFTVVQFKNE